MRADQLLTLFEQGENSWLGQLVRTSLWLFPAIETVHLLGLCLLGGAVLVVDLRLFGLGLRTQPLATVARGAAPWMALGVGVMLTTGFLLFLSEAVKCYHSPSFWVKMLTLPFALLFAFAIRQRIAVKEPAPSSWTQRLLATASLGLWFTVAMAGRWIGFSS